MANVKHWHGAKKDSWFSHIAVEVPGEETANKWLEAVSSEEYDKLDEKVLTVSRVCMEFDISNCFAYQLAKANALAEKEGFAGFVSIQGHYNLIFREEREMAKRLEEDGRAKCKDDATAQQDSVIMWRRCKSNGADIDAGGALLCGRALCAS